MGAEGGESSARHRRQLGWLLGIAVLVRLVSLLAYHPVLLNDTDGHAGPTYVPLSYRALAVSLYEGDLTDDLGARSPGYPAFMAASYRAFGLDNNQAIVGIQSLLGILLFASAYWLWSQLYGAGSAALAATAVAVLEPALVLSESTILSETLSVWLLVTSLALLVHVGQSGRCAALAAAACGVCVGWLALTRPAFQLLIPIYAVYLTVRFWPTRRRLRRWASLALLVCTASAPVVAWSALNQERFDYFTLMTTQGFILTSHTEKLIAGRAERYGEYADIAALLDENIPATGMGIWKVYPEIMRTRGISFAEASHLCQELSLRVIRDDPVGYLNSALTALGSFWHGRWVTGPPETGRLTWILAFTAYDYLTRVACALIFALFVLDLIRPRQWLDPPVTERMLIWSVVLAVCLSSSLPIAVENARYKMPLLPLLWGLLAAGIAVNAGTLRATWRRWR